MQSEGLALLEANMAFGPAGPWTVAVGNWSEVDVLFRFDSLREHEELIAGLPARPTRRNMAGEISELTDEITTRVLVPAKFAQHDESTPTAVSLCEHRDAERTRQWHPQNWLCKRSKYETPARIYSSDNCDCRRPVVRRSSPARAPWPHHEEIAPGVHVIGFADKFRSANCGLVVKRGGNVCSWICRAGSRAAAISGTTSNRVSGKPAIASA